MEEIEHIAIDMDVPVEIPMEKIIENKMIGEGEEDNLQILIQKRLHEVPKDPFADKTIFRVPSWLHEAHKGLFEPRKVSIGPYHRDKKSLRFMEEQKWSFLRDFLARGQNVGIEVYIQEIRSLEARARRCYSENVDMKSDDFVMMLLLDGCFLLEHFIRLSRLQDNAHRNVVWAAGNLHSDMFLLENQIPFFVIHKLFAIQWGRTHNCDNFNCPLLDVLFITPVCLPFNILSEMGMPTEVSCSNIYHYLHLVYACIVRSDQRKKENRIFGESHSRDAGLQTDATSIWRNNALRSELKKRYTKPMRIPCASMLHEAGVTFKSKKNARDMFDISFNNGIMELPFSPLTYDGKILYANIAAFEQAQGFYISQTPFTSHLVLMDALVNTKEDVALLQRSGIIDSALRTEKDATDFFNDLGECLGASKYGGHYLFDKIRRYNDSTWHKQRARLMHDYFSNPWSSITVVGAGILLILSVLQTYYSAK